MASTPLSEVLISEQLMKRIERPILSTFTNAVMVELDRVLAEQPADFMVEAARAAKILPGGHSGGVSLVREGGDCRTHAVEGRWQQRPESLALFDRGLCSLALERKNLMLMSRPQRALPELQALYPPIEEALLAPFFLDGRPCGVVWAVFHNSELQFDIHDGYMLQDLARLLADAHGRLASLGALAA